MCLLSLACRNTWDVATLCFPMTSLSSCSPCHSSMHISLLFGLTSDFRLWHKAGEKGHSLKTPLRYRCCIACTPHSPRLPEACTTRISQPAEAEPVHSQQRAGALSQLGTGGRTTHLLLLLLWELGWEPASASKPPRQGQSHPNLSPGVTPPAAPAVPPRGTHPPGTSSAHCTHPQELCWGQAQCAYSLGVSPASPASHTLPLQRG